MVSLCQLHQSYACQQQCHGSNQEHHILNYLDWSREVIINLFDWGWMGSKMDFIHVIKKMIYVHDTRTKQV